jgi:ABC-type Fe3+/spermidine/putrescine transport system ATPase subunit
VIDIELRGVSKRYGEVQALDQIDLQVHQGETVALLGPSGCGKSTLLSVVAGLESHEGTILWRGRDISTMPTSARRFGVVFQDYALFPHLNVFENVAFGLRVQREPTKQISARVAEVLEIVGLNEFGRRDVTTLSGGERQRVALARALAPQPVLLMLDEPLAALDRNLRDRLSEDLAVILRELDLPSIYITHDVEEAMVVADRVAIMQPGRIAQIGTPQEIYQAPKSEFVGRFLGLDNMVNAHWEQRDGRRFLRTNLGLLPAEYLPQNVEEKLDTKLLLLPNGALFEMEESIETNDENWVFRGEVRSQSFRGSVQRIEIAVGEIILRFRMPADITVPTPGSIMTISIDPRRGACLIPPQVVEKTSSTS